MQVCKRPTFRCDVNVSIRPKGQKEFGTRVEDKKYKPPLNL